MVELEKVFALFDTDGSGFIEVDELHAVLDALGLDSRNDDAVLLALAELRTTSPGRVTFEELAEWWSGAGARAASTTPNDADERSTSPAVPPTNGVPREPRRLQELPNEVQLLTLFRRFDADDNGVIDATELARLLEAAGREPDDAELKSALERFDSNGDGELSWTEFLGWWDAMLEERR